MGLFVRAVVNGFGLSLGAALFKKVQRHLGLEDEKDKKSEGELVNQEGATDPKLQAT